MTDEELEQYYQEMEAKQQTEFGKFLHRSKMLGFKHGLEGKVFNRVTDGPVNYGAYDEGYDIGVFARNYEQTKREAQK